MKRGYSFLINTNHPDKQFFHIESDQRSQNSQQFKLRLHNLFNFVTFFIYCSCPSNKDEVISALDAGGKLSEGLANYTLCTVARNRITDFFAGRYTDTAKTRGFSLHMIPVRDLHLIYLDRIACGNLCFDLKPST